LFCASALIPNAGAQIPVQTARFGRSLDTRVASLEIKPTELFTQPPLTISCWSRLQSATSFNILVAHATKESAAHWEIYTAAGSGKLAVYLPGALPSIVESNTKLTDDIWHYVTFVYERTRARLYVDALLVIDQALTSDERARDPGPLWIGAYPPQEIACDGWIDELSVSAGAMPPQDIPRAPGSADGNTLGLWHLDETNGTAFYSDASSRASSARAMRGPNSPPEFDADASPSYRTADPSLQVIRLDRSLNESFIAVRVDTAGRIFIGGREAVFVLEPNGQGGYAERFELFRFPAHSWVGDIEIRGDDLYVATAAAIYRLPNARLKREGISAEKLVWGTPVDLHVTYHGLAFGPEGDLYFNSGDPLLNYGDFNRPDHFGHWTIFSGPNGKPTPHTGVGAVYRCRPDGSNLEVYATGLRGSDGLCFSETWDLFTNDNDHESLPDRYTPYRILHVTPGADFGWPRGWAARRSPERNDLIDPINPGLGRGVPVGQCYYGDTFLPATYQKSLLVAQWGHRAVTAYRLIANGATFTTEERPLLNCEGRARPVGVCVGRGGRVFVTVAYMAQNEGSPTYASDLIMVTRGDDDATHAFDAYEAPSATIDHLLSEIGTSEWSRRAAAHQALLMLNPNDVLSRPRQELDTSGHASRAAHQPWILPLPDLRGKSPPLNGSLSQVDELRRNLISRYLRHHGANALWMPFWAKCLREAEPRLQVAVLGGLSQLDATVFHAILDRPAHSSDRVVRQSAARLLEHYATLAQLDQLILSEDASLRLLGVLAVGMRLTVPEPSTPIPDQLPLNYRSENALFIVNYAGETANLRELGRIGSFTMAESWKSLPHSPDQESLFHKLMTALVDTEEPVRLQAAYYLSLLNDPRSEPAIAEVTSEAEIRKLRAVAPRAVDALWILGPVDASRSKETESSAVDLGKKYDGLGWLMVSSDSGEYPLAASPNRVEYALFRLQSQRPSRAIATIACDTAISVRLNGRSVYENEVAVIPGFRNTIPLTLVPGSNTVLICFTHDDKPRKALLTIQTLDGVSVDLPKYFAGSGISERLKEGTPGDVPIPEAFLSIDWPSTVARANIERGRLLFGSDGIGCAKCHAIAPGESGAGAPSLTDARQRFTLAHLVESVLLPSAQVANEFRATSISMRDGRLIRGLVTSETAESLEILQPDATKIKLDVVEIEERKTEDTSAMPAALVKTPEELADLIAFILRTE
jgi:putative heme-binding domain-containing protein